MSIFKFIDFIALEKKGSIHTQIAYKKNLEEFQAFLEETFDHKDLTKAIYPEIRNWIVCLIEKGNSTRTVNRKLSVLRSYYKFLLHIGNVDISPMQKHQPLKMSKKIAMPFSEDEIKQVLKEENFTPNFLGTLQRTLIALLYFTGMRRSELIHLKQSSYDQTACVLKVLGKRNKERIVPILPEMEALLNTYFQVKNKVLLTNSEFLLISEKGEKLSEYFVYKTVNDYFNRVSSKLKKRPHMIRHSFATHLLDRGADLNSIKELLGHSSIASTQVYTHSSLSQIQSIYEKTHPRGKNKS